MFASFTGILMAVVSAKVKSKTIDPPQYLTEIIGVIASIPYIGAAFSYCIVSMF